MSQRWLSVGVVAAMMSAAHADPNVVGRISTRADGAKTLVTVHGSAKPSFAVYRLEKPARLVLDFADGKLGPQTLPDGPVDVDSWAVGQIAAAQYSDQRTRTARVMIGFRRPASYDVKTVGHDVVITVTADEAPPAGLAELEAKRGVAAKATTEAESKRRAAEDARQTAEEGRRSAEAARAAATTATQTSQAERQAAEQAAVLAQQKRKDAETQLATVERERMALAQKMDALRWQARTAESEREKSVELARAEAQRRSDAQEKGQRAADAAQKLAEEAEQKAQAARARAQAASEELGRVLVARKTLANDVDRLKAQTSESTQAMDKLRAERVAEQGRVEKLRREAESLAAERRAEPDRLAAAQAAEAKAAGERSARLDEARRAAEKRAEAAEATRVAEERALKARAEEAERLERAARAARAAQAAEAQVKKAEARARAAAEAAGVEQARAEKQRLETRALAAEAATARVELEKAKRDGQRLLLEQDAARGALSRAATDAEKLADVRAAEVRKAALATASAARSQSMMAAAEVDARKLAETRAREVARLEDARRETQELARKKTDAQRRLDAALADSRRKLDSVEEAAKTAAARRATEEEKLQVASAALDERMAASEKLKARAVELQRQATSLTAETQALSQKGVALKSENGALKNENGRLADERSALKNENGRLQTEKQQLEAKVASVKRQLDDLGSKKPEPAHPAIKQRPVVRLAPAALSVTDVRFEDDADKSRVVVELSSDAAIDTTRVSGEPRTVVLRLAGVTLPTALERTLDVSAYRGALRSLTTYVDAEDPQAVRVVARLTAPADGEPRVVRDGKLLRWEFARPAVATSFQPTRVGGFGTTLPREASPLASIASNSPLRRKVYTGRRISLDFKDLDIHNLLRLLGDVGGVNVVISDDVKGSVTISMKDVPWDQALDVVLRSKGLGVQKDGNLYRVALQSVLEKETEAEVARAKAQVELKPIITRLVSASYAEADKLVPRVQEMLSPRGKVSVDIRTNTLILSDVSANVELAEELISRLDTPTPQVLIEARIVEATTQFTRDLGVQWGGNAISSAATGNPTGLFFPSTLGVAGGAVDSQTTGANVAGLQSGAASPNYLVNLPAAVGTGSGGAIGVTFGSVNGAFNINMRLSALENTGNVRIISAPKITTLDNVEASIEQGVAIPISVVSAAGTNTQFVDAKLNLTVKPHVTNEGSIIMKISLMRNEPDFVNTGARGDPTIDKRQAKTEMLVKDGDTAVIGGIYTRNSGVSYNKVPWIADVPVIGWLFKSRHETDNRGELLIFVTPRIVNRGAMRR